MSRNIYSKDLITNATTGLMALRDLATCHKVPINIHLSDHYIHVIVGFGTSRQERKSFYYQDMYRFHSIQDTIYDWIEETLEEFEMDKGE